MAAQVNNAQTLTGSSQHPLGQPAHQPGQGPPATQAATQEEMRHALNRVLTSKHFVHAPMKQKFLRLTCDFHLSGRGAELNEYLIGREVFDRDDAYNPATDPIVRVGAHGVREKLALYYQKEGVDDEFRIEIPVGSYEPVFIRTGQALPVEAAMVSSADVELERQSPAPPPGAMDARPARDESKRRATGKWMLAAMRIAVVTLLVTVIVLLYIVLGQRGKVESLALAVAKNRDAQGAVWEPFLKNPEPTLLILSNPTVHRAVTGADPDVATRRAITLTAEQATILTNASGGRLPLKQDKPLQLIPAFNMYTGIGEAIGVYRLSSLLQAVGEQTLLKQSRSIAPEDLRDYDIILLGSVYSNQWSKPLSIKENFVYTTRATIENLAPAQGEQNEYKAVFDDRAGNLLEDYALITVTPGVTGQRTIMVLAGIYSEGTEAAADFVTNASYLNELNQRLRQLRGQSDPPRYYQALLKVRVENSFPTKVSLLTVRELQAAQ
ncbi:MAG TPA: hypothetical protein VFV58_10390 [Blastocatellia bacterium]|jgi:hypothetical protein|nr:hypothetical protein [Blastocatellia bacterium]